MDKERDDQNWTDLTRVIVLCSSSCIPYLQEWHHYHPAALAKNVCHPWFSLILLNSYVWVGKGNEIDIRYFGLDIDRELKIKH